MNVTHLVLREIRHRLGSFALGLLSVTVAVGCMVGAMTMLKADAIRTDEIITAKQQEVRQAVADKEKQVAQAGKELKDAYRKITIGLGFNIWILPAEQDLGEFHAQGELKAMPEQLVTQLAESKIVTINHVLPVVIRRMLWEEFNQTIILTGTRGEVPLMHRAAKKPMQDLVPKGTIVLGHSLHTRNKLATGDKVTLLDREFTVTETYDQRGTTDDITAWINLGEAQELLGMQNLVNGILALECNCATKDRIGEIRAEIAGILPGTQVIEQGTKALARAEARNKAKQAADASLKNEKEAGEAAIATEKVGREQLRGQRESFVATLVPIVFVACAAWLCLLAFGNVRQRIGEIGILRAIGLRSVDILFIFLSKTLLLGLVGSLIGYLSGFGVGVLWGDLPVTAGSMQKLFSQELLLGVLIAAPLLSVLAGWLPAMLAARQDPAVVLQES